MIIRTANDREHRAFSPGLNYGNTQAYGISGALPPHGWDSIAPSGVSITEKTVTQASPVNRSISIIANLFLYMQLPYAYRLAYGADNQPYRSYIAPLPQLLMEPWAAPMLPSEGFISTIFSLALFGECFWLTLGRDPDGTPLALEILPVPFMDVTRDSGGLHYQMQMNQVTSVFQTADITHIRLRPRPGQLHGVSSLREQALGYGLYLAALQYGLAYYGQGVQSSYVLTTDAKLTEDVAERTIKKLVIEHAGLSSAHIPMLFDSGIKPQTIGITPDDAGMMDSLNQGTNDCAAYFGIPASWVGGTTQEIAKTLEEEFSFVARTTLPAFYRPIQEALSRLLPGGQMCAFDTQTLERPVGKSMAQELLAMRSGTIMTPNEIRRYAYSLGPALNGDGDDLNAPLASNQSPGMNAAVTTTGSAD